MTTVTTQAVFTEDEFDDIVNIIKNEARYCWEIANGMNHDVIHTQAEIDFYASRAHYLDKLIDRIVIHSISTHISSEEAND